MSHTTRRKHVLKEMMADDYELPTEQQQIVRVVSSRGNNLHEVEAPLSELDNYLVSMPKKFRKNMWVKRGDFILVEPIEEGDKVKAEIWKILTPTHVKEYTRAGVWPARFAKKSEALPQSNEGSDDDDLLTPNTNRPVQVDDDDDDDETDHSNSSDED